MSENKIDNPPAFPTVEHDSFMGLPVVNTYQGMTLRDYFAAKVMQGELINPEGYSFSSEESMENGCKFAYKVADAMLKARNA